MCEGRVCAGLDPSTEPLGEAVSPAQCNFIHPPTTDTVRHLLRQNARPSAPSALAHTSAAPTVFPTKHVVRSVLNLEAAHSASSAQCPTPALPPAQLLASPIVGPANGCPATQPMVPTQATSSGEFANSTSNTATYRRGEGATGARLQFAVGWAGEGERGLESEYVSVLSVMINTHWCITIMMIIGWLQ